MQSSPSCWPAKGLEKMIFFPLFVKHPWEAQQKSLGQDAHRRGQDVPPAPGVVPELRPHHGPEAGPGRTSRLAPCASSQAWEQRKGNIPHGESGFAAPSARASTLQPAGTATPGTHRLKQSLSAEIRTLCKVIRVFLDAVW